MHFLIFGLVVRFMRVVLDYLTFTFKFTANLDNPVQFFINRFNLSGCNFLELLGRYGWETRKYYMGCSFLFGGCRDDICVEFSGKGCRTIETLNPDFDWLAFFKEMEPYFADRFFHIARLDIAADDHDGILRYKRIVRCLDRRHYICKSRYKIWINGDERAIYFGAPASDRRLRIYDKALEQDLPDQHWMRCEMQLRNDNAVSFLLNWFKYGSVGYTYSGVLRDYLRFVTATVENRNYDSAVICPWWEKFIGEVGKISQLYLEKLPYTNDTVRNFVEHYCSSSLKTFLALNGGDLEDLIKIIEGAKLNNRQLQLLNSINSEVLNAISLK